MFFCIAKFAENEMSLTHWLFLLVDVVSSKWLVGFNYLNPPLVKRRQEES